MSTPCVVTSSRSEPCWGRAERHGRGGERQGRQHERRVAQPHAQAGAHAQQTRQRPGTRRRGPRDPARAATPRPARAAPGAAAQSHAGSWKRRLRPVHHAALPSSSAAAGGVSFASSAGTSARDRREVALAPRPPRPWPLRELDAVGRLGQVAHDGQQLAGVRMRAQERERLGRRHLENGRAEPALEVALRDRGQARCRRPQLAARPAGPRPPARRARGSASTSGGSAPARSERHGCEARLRLRISQNASATSSRTATAEGDPERRARRRPPPGRGCRRASARLASFGSSETTLSASGAVAASPVVPSASR